jgi:hypothetical protein
VNTDQEEEVAEEAIQELNIEIDQREDKENRNHFTLERINKTKRKELVKTNNNKRVNINHIMKIDKSTIIKTNKMLLRVINSNNPEDKSKLMRVRSKREKKNNSQSQ